MGMINRLTRVSTLGIVGESPKSKVRKEQAKLLKAQRKAIEDKREKK
jgi:hypothetical protein